MDVLRLDHNIIAGEMFALKSSGGLSASTILRITLNYGIIIITDMSRERERGYRTLANIIGTYQRIMRKTRISVLTNYLSFLTNHRYFEERISGNEVSARRMLDSHESGRTRYPLDDQSPALPQLSGVRIKQNIYTLFICKWN